MATTVTSAWSKPGAWALDSEAQDALDALQPPQQHHQSPPAQHAFDFPSLTDAATSKPSRKKKPKNTLSLAEFTTGNSVSHGSAKSSSASKGLTADELLRLPTGPRERSADDPDRSSSRLGGAFYSSRPRISSSDESSGSFWGSGHRGFSDEPRQQRAPRDPPPPSRADETDDWGAAKKSSSALPPPPPPTSARGGGGGFFDSHSRADGANSWISNKSLPPPAEGRRGGGFGSGFEGFGSRERKGGFDLFGKEAANGGADSDAWGKKREEAAVERPRLVLHPRSAAVNNGEQQQQPRSKGSNPFGEARPREEVLAEKGQDWKKIDKQLDSVKLKEPGPAEAAPFAKKSFERTSEGAPFAKKGFGTGNGHASLPEDQMMKSWRKADATNATPRRRFLITTLLQKPTRR